MLTKAAETVNEKMSRLVAEHQRTDADIKSRQEQLARLSQEIGNLTLYRAELSGQIKMGSEILPLLQDPAAPPAEGGN